MATVPSVRRAHEGNPGIVADPRADALLPDRAAVIAGRAFVPITPALGTAAWYGDTDLQLELPQAWEVIVHWPSTPPPLRDEDVARSVAQPIGQLRLEELARGRRRACIVVDDLTRPTPAAAHTSMSEPISRVRSRGRRK
jgi:hypothetical protein